MDNGIRILTEDEFKKMSVSIERRAQMSDVAYYFSNKNMRMCYEPYLLETGSVPKIVKNDGLIHEFKAIKMGRKFDVNLQGRVVAVTNYNLNLLKQMGIRPVIPLSMIPENIANNTTNYFSYGFYPVNIPKQADQNLITVMFLSSSCNSLYSIKLDGKSYHAIEIHTPEHGIQKFINLKEHTHKFTEDNLVHSEYMWAELKRIEWAIDRDLGLAIANFIPMTNIDFNNTFYYKSFKDTNLYKWLNGEFLNTIMVNEDEKLIIPKKQKKQKVNIIDFKNTEAYKKIIDSVTFLSFEECYDENKKLDIFKYINPSALATDFARLTGAGNNGLNKMNEDREYWSKTICFDHMISLIGLNGVHCSMDGREVCIRPVIPYSLISKYLDKNKIRQCDGYIEFEFGFYPQKAPSDDLQNELDACEDSLSVDFDETDSTYTIDDTDIDEIEEPFNEWVVREYSYKGKKYVSIDANLSSERVLLSNNEEYAKYVDVWVEVLPVTWIASVKDDVAMPKDLLLAGIQFNFQKNTSFDKSDIKKFVQKYFLPNIFQSVKINMSKLENISEDKNKAINNNIDTFNINLSNFSFNDIDTQIEMRKKELGIDEESIKEFKEKIKNVSNDEAGKLGNELVDKLLDEDDNENYEEFLKLIMSGANVNFKNTEYNLSFPLIICARNNFLKTFITLIKAGADINMVTDFGMTSAMIATTCGNKEILEILILLGADINLKNFNGDTALSLASLYEKKECFDMLVEAGAHLNSTNLKGQSIFEDGEEKKDIFSSDDLLSEALTMLQELDDESKNNSDKKLIKSFRRI